LSGTGKYREYAVSGHVDNGAGVVADEDAYERERARQPYDRPCLVTIHQAAIAVNVRVEDRAQPAIEIFATRVDHFSHPRCFDSQYGTSPS